MMIFCMNFMIFRLFRLKVTLWFRVLKGETLFSLLFLAALLSAAVLLFLKFCGTSPYNYCFLGAVAASLFAIHETRRDYHFCEMMLDHPYLLFSLEYLLICIPFIAISALKGQYVHGVLYAVLPFVTAVSPQFVSRFSPSRKLFFIPMPSLETTSFFRKYGAVVWIMLSASLALSFVPAVSVLILYVSIIIYACSTFQQAESLTLLCFDELPAKPFLKRKIKRELVFWAKLSLPVCALYCIFNVETAYYVLVPIILGSLYVVFCICSKYSQYKPDGKIEGSVSQAIGFLGYIIPVLLPLSLIMTFVFYFQAIDNLNNYLDAYNR